MDANPIIGLKVIRATDYPYSRWGMRLLERLGAIRLFFITSILILAACILGGVIPQGQPIERYQEMFGPALTGWIGRLGLNNLFGSFWFLGLLALAGVNLAACSLRRYKALFMRPGVFLSHLAIMLIFAGGMLRGAYGQRGYLPMEKGQALSSFDDDRSGKIHLPFSVQLKDFRLLYWENERHALHVVPRDSTQGHQTAELRAGEKLRLPALGLEIEPVRYYPDFVITEAGAGSKTDAPENPAWELKVGGRKDGASRFVFANFPDFHGPDKESYRLVYEYIPGRIRQYESDIEIVEDGQTKLSQTIYVNSPLKYKGYRLYQSGFDPKNLNFSGIQIAKDPGVPVIYAGFSFLVIGLAWSFWGPNSSKRR